MLSAASGVGVVGVAGCLDGRSEADAAGRSAFASFFTLAEFARAVRGEELSVENPVDPGSHGHEWEPSADLLPTVVDADAFVHLDVSGFQPWAEHVATRLDDDHEQVKLIDALDGIDLIPYDGHDHGHDDGHDHDHGHDHGHDHAHDDGSYGHSHGEYDAKFFTDPVLAQRGVRNVRDGVIARTDLSSRVRARARSHGRGMSDGDRRRTATGSRRTAEGQPSLPDRWTRLEQVGLAAGIGETVAHAAFALVAAVAGAVGVQQLTAHTDDHGDVPIAIVLAGSFAVGVLVLDLGGGFATVEIGSYLFGGISVTDDRSVTVMAALTLAVLGVLAVTYKQLLFITFDEQAARVAAAAQVARSFRRALYGSIFVGEVSVLSGLVLAWTYGLRPGAAIVVVVAVGIYLIAVVVKNARGGQAGGFGRSGSDRSP
ncbi:hypothetical protein JCM18237_13140 [Halorubrum luteum]